MVCSPCFIGIRIWLCSKRKEECHIRIDLFFILSVLLGQRQSIERHLEGSIQIQTINLIETIANCQNFKS